MAVPDQPSANPMNVKCLDCSLAVRGNIYASFAVAPFYILISTCLTRIYFSLKYYGVPPQANAKSLPYTAIPVCYFVLDPSVYYMSPPFPNGTISLSHSLLSGKLTINGLWNVCLSIIFLVCLCKMGSVIMYPCVPVPQ